LEREKAVRINNKGGLLFTELGGTGGGKMVSGRSAKQEKFRGDGRYCRAGGERNCSTTAQKKKDRQTSAVLAKREKGRRKGKGEGDGGQLSREKKRGSGPF